MGCIFICISLRSIGKIVEIWNRHISPSCIRILIGHLVHIVTQGHRAIEFLCQLFSCRYNQIRIIFLMKQGILRDLSGRSWGVVGPDCKMTFSLIAIYIGTSPIGKLQPIQWIVGKGKVAEQSIVIILKRILVYRPIWIVAIAFQF